MTSKVSVRLDGSFVTYEVQEEIDGIYQATLLNKGFGSPETFPQKIILIKCGGDNWTSDCPIKEIGLQIGQKISEWESTSNLVALKASVTLPGSEPQIITMAPSRILIIDDDEDDVAILSDAFIRCGIHNVHSVFSGIQAFVYLREIEPSSLPQLIIADHYLPGMTGAEFLKDLKEMAKYKHIHFVVLSTTKSEKQIEKYREMGALDYLIKPTSYDDYVRVAADMKKSAGL